MFKDTNKLVLISFIIVLTANFILFVKTITYTPIFSDTERFDLQLLFFSAVQWIWLLAGLALIIKSIIIKEKKNMKFKVSAIGLAFILLLNLLSTFLQV